MGNLKITFVSYAFTFCSGILCGVLLSAVVYAYCKLNHVFAFRWIVNPPQQSKTVLQSPHITKHIGSLVGENTEGGEEGNKSVSEAADVKKRKKSAKTKKVRHADQHSTEGTNGHLPNGNVTLEKLSKEGVSADTVSPLRPHAYLLNTSSNTEHETTVPSPVESPASQGNLTSQTIVEEAEEAKEDENQNELQGLTSDVSDTTTAVDPIVGRYRMTSSEGFEEWMKAMGVGWTKRKLANSVIPVNVIEISPQGVYTVRTETTVKTSEIHFRLNEEFDETTVDGSVTKTTPTRKGNFLSLEQKGNKEKGEKDTRMTRDFQGDVFYMEIWVEDTVCKRVYERIKHDE